VGDGRITTIPVFENIGFSLMAGEPRIQPS
jgi:hypothetical protein